ncbi:hypothetical protein BJ322DRAFT_1019917 [Thelephora terrestris]|uniref:DUF6532 domain-containing protein n=1 Tax=Thelephora terrestris TaxID=56493 RepID=A0A9P6HI86_9AGAM|nr:hypothetical protein BJ322DRAFT_1019917 [Thelephora terrestris]
MSRRGIRREGSVAKQRDRRVLVGTVENAEGSHLDLAQRLSICPKYGHDNGLEKTAAAARVQKLLDDEAFHFGKTNSGTPNKAAPYQHPEITSCISHFFKGRNSYGVAYSAQIHHGKYGAEMPQAMVALVTTAIQVALGEWKTGVQVKRPFTETDHRETYRDHVVVMQMVRDSEKGESKIYAQTMKCLNGDKSTSTSTASVPRKKLVIDIDTMEE